MPVCNCLIEATKGQQVRYYHATVEEDGFVYFNDRSFYRVETPQNLVQDLENEQTVTITSGIQYWYVVRDIWVYANRFDRLELSMPPEFDVQPVEDAINDLIDDVNELGRRALDNNGEELYKTWQDLNHIVHDLANQGITAQSPHAISVYNQWPYIQHISL